MDIQNNEEIIKHKAYLSIISAVKERMCTLRHQTRDFEAWRKTLSEEAMPRETLQFMISCTTRGDADMRLLPTKLVRVEEIAGDIGPINNEALEEGVVEIEQMHFVISRQQEMMHVASLLFLFPERDTNLNDPHALILAARTADFLIAYSLHTVHTLKSMLETQRVAIQDTQHSITAHFQSSDSDVSAMWLVAKTNFLEKSIIECNNYTATISSFYSKFYLNQAGHRVITANDWYTIQNDTQCQQIQIVLCQHLYTIFFTNVTGGYQNAIDIIASA